MLAHVFLPAPLRAFSPGLRCMCTFYLMMRNTWPSQKVEQVHRGRNTLISMPFDLSRVGLTNEAHPAETESFVKKSLQALEADLAALSLRQTQLVEAIERYKVAIAPHKKLSEDVLRYIFTLSCDIETCFPLHRNNVQLALCAVCSVWRRIALDTPRLWNEVIIMLLADNPSSRAALITTVQSWLTRAGNMPKSLSVKWHSGEENIVLFAHLFSAHPYRKIHLSMNSKQSLQWIIAGLPNDTLLHLEDLELQHWSYRSDDESLPVLCDSPIRLPNLTSLRIANVYWNPQFHKTANIPWHSLHRLDIRFAMPASFCFEILRESSSLSHCNLAVEAEPTFVTSHPSFAESPLISNVQYLTLGFENEIAAEPFIRLLVLPAIVELHLMMSDLRTTLGCTTSDLSNMARRSQMKVIRVFSVWNCRGPLDIAVVLQDMPSLEGLKIYGKAMLDDQALEDLGAGRLGRHLRSICVGDAESVARLKQAVALRRIAAENDRNLVVPFVP
ncbi:hypothetical protein AX15_001896 [Amanita polypyramis BW_CC]|nr:hypothetical protein AX15_001896 [Amanita polypyramis BW_CC]